MRHICDIISALALFGDLCENFPVHRQERRGGVLTRAAGFQARRFVAKLSINRETCNWQKRRGGAEF